MTNSLYNEDERHAPEWLNQEFFEKLFCEALNCPVKVLDYTISPGTAKADHYASCMFRARINYVCKGEKKMQSLVIKTEPTLEGVKKDSMGKFQLFETEIKMYTETLPKIEAILLEHGDNTKLGAKLFYHALEPQKCLIFEDMVEKDYKVVSNRFCTLAEVKLTLLKLAKLHAVSFKLAKEGDAAIIAHKHGSFSTADIADMDFVKNSISCFKEAIAQYDDLRVYLPHIENVEEGILGKCIASFNNYQNGERDGIFVLNHGDFHMKNMLVKNVAGHLKDICLVDYQISVFGSPAIDLMYAIFMMLSPELRLNARDELIYYYFINFQETLKMISFEGHIPTLTELQDEVRKYRHWELFLFMGFLPFNYVFSSENGDLGKAVEDKDYRRKIYESPEVLTELRALLPKYLYQGYFEN